MSVASDKAFTYIVGVEGKLSMDPRDKGNWTGGRIGVGELRGSKYGMSAAAHPAIDIANLTIDGVKSLFESEYWAKIRGDEVPYPIALCLADDAYNHGPSMAVKNLQQALKLKVDGEFGPVTLSAAIGANVRELVKEFQAQRAIDYARDPNEALYGHDWFRERVIGTALEALS